MKQLRGVRIIRAKDESAVMIVAYQEGGFKRKLQLHLLKGERIADVLAKEFPEVNEDVLG